MPLSAPGRRSCGPNKFSMTGIVLLMSLMTIFAGCGDESRPRPTPTPTPTATPTPTPTPTPTATPTPTPSPTATPTPSPTPSPVITFTTTPPESANEGDDYTYEVAATSSGDGTVSLELTAAPEGAALSEGIVAWTPTHSQSRAPHSFSVTATSTDGATDTQDWTVTPTGTIRGSRIVTYRHSGGTEDVPRDLSPEGPNLVGAYVPDGDGGFALVQGSGSAAGDFAVPGVSAGHFWLIYNSSLIWTNSNDVDLGYDAIGRPDYIVSAAGTSLTLQMTNLSPWQLGDHPATSVSNVDSALFWNLSDPASLVGDTALNLSFPWQGRPLLDASAGDQLYATQMVSTPVGSESLLYAAKYSGPLDITMVNGVQSTNLAPMSDVTLDSTLHVAINGAEFDQLRTQEHPGATTEGTWFDLEIYPASLDHGLVGNTSNLVLYWPATPITTDQTIGDFSYGNPYPESWEKVIRYWHSFTVPFMAPGATVPFNVSLNNYLESTNVDSTDPIGPAIGPVVAPLINGEDFFTAQTIATPEVTISWQAPSIGSATAYSVRVYEFYNNSGTSSSWHFATFYTDTTSVALPVGQLESGNTYLIRITAQSVPGVDVETNPFRYTAPYAEADVISGIMTYSGAMSGAISSAKYSKSRQASPAESDSETMRDDEPVRPADNTMRKPANTASFR